MYEVQLASDKTCEAVLLENLKSVSSKDEHLFAKKATFPQVKSYFVGYWFITIVDG